MDKTIQFLKTFAELIEQGYSLSDTIDICDDIYHLEKQLQFHKQCEKGVTINELIEHKMFPVIIIDFFHYYNKTQPFSKALLHSINIYESIEFFKSYMISKLTYPLALLVFLFGFSIFTSLVLFPQVTLLFESFDVSMSFALKTVMFIYKCIPIALILILSYLSYKVFRFIYAIRNKKYKIIETYLNYPVIGEMIKKYFSLQLSVYFVELSKEIRDIKTILNMLSTMMNKKELKIVLYEMQIEVQKGEPLEQVVESFQYFDSLFIQFFRLYMLDTKMNDCLILYNQITKTYFENLFTRFIKILVPSIYLFVTSFVVIIYISVILPMMNIFSQL